MYSLLGLGVWLGFLFSGLHPTLSGILAAFAIPIRTRIDGREFLEQSREALTAFEKLGKVGTNVQASKEQKGAMLAVELAVSKAQSPLVRLEHLIHPWVAYLIMPLFALANAGVHFDIKGLQWSNPVLVGVVCGLVIGKQVGILSFTYLAVKLKLAKLPEGLTWMHVYIVSCLGGIGFTMAIFIGNLAFTIPRALEVGKVGILVGSMISAIMAVALTLSLKRSKT